MASGEWEPDDCPIADGLHQRWMQLWDTLADEGGADGLGGAQYGRATFAWIGAGRPALPDWLLAWLEADDAAAGRPERGA